MDYCIPPYSAVVVFFFFFFVFFFFVFFFVLFCLFFIEQGFAWIVTVWNTNEDRNSIDFDSRGQKILEK